MSLQITRVKGIPIRLHYTLIIVFFLITFTVSVYLMPDINPGLTTLEYWIMGIICAVILFVSVLLHELAHSIIALRYGIKVRQIILFIFGGMSDIEEEMPGGGEVSKDFGKEFKIAVAGPVTSFIIAGVLGILLVMVSLVNGNEVSDRISSMVLNIIKGVLWYGMVINIILGGFNLIPAFPMDGGRILRAALLRWKKDFDQATRISVKAGIAMSYVFMGMGFLIMFSGSFVSGMWLLLIGWFLNSGAQSYLSEHELMRILSTIPLDAIMNTRIITVGENLTIDSLIKDYFNLYSKDSFPVLSREPDANRLLGMVTFKDASNLTDSERSLTKTNKIMIPKADLIIMSENRKANEALLQISRKRMGKVFVCNNDGKLIGVVSKTDIMNAASEKSEYEKAARNLHKEIG
ncbi:MAG: site-2 protease family protein [Nitrososphaeraceae archaeon]